MNTSPVLIQIDGVDADRVTLDLEPMVILPAHRRIQQNSFARLILPGDGAQIRHVGQQLIEICRMELLTVIVTLHRFPVILGVDDDFTAAGLQRNIRLHPGQETLRALIQRFRTPGDVLTTHLELLLLTLVKVAHELLENRRHQPLIPKKIPEFHRSIRFRYQQAVIDQLAYFQQKIIKDVVAVQLHHAEVPLRQRNALNPFEAPENGHQFRADRAVQITATHQPMNRRLDDLVVKHIIAEIIEATVETCPMESMMLHRHGNIDLAPDPVDVFIDIDIASVQTPV